MCQPHLIFTLIQELVLRLVYGVVEKLKVICGQHRHEGLYDFLLSDVRGGIPYWVVSARFHIATARTTAIPTWLWAITCEIQQLSL